MRHDLRCTFLGPNRILVRLAGRREPTSECHFLARVEVDAFSPLDVQVAKERLIPPGKWKPGHGCGNTDVNADHAGIKALLELAGRIAVTGEDRRAISELALVTHGNRRLEIVRSNNGQHRTKDLFLGDPH